MEQLPTLKATKFEVSPTGIATVTLSRPASLNALSGDLNREVEHHFQVTQPRCWLARGAWRADRRALRAVLRPE